MRKKEILFFICIYTFFYLLNYLTPMGFGDDYLYSFIWQGKPEFIPLNEDAVRVSSWHDLFISQWSHYFTWSGRTVNHTLAQFFLWLGKEAFNFFNACITTLLIVEIYWCINRGRVSFDFRIHKICYIVFALWAFTPGFPTVFLWLDGACNYLWTNVILLGFLLPYIQKYYCFPKVTGKGTLFSLFFFLFGILTGWTNENSICWVILVLCIFLVNEMNRNGTEKWMAGGLAGLILGYSLLMLAPGNIARLQAVHGLNGMNITVIENSIHNSLNSFLKVIYFQIFMWYFGVRALLEIKQTHFIYQNKYYYKDFLLTIVLCLLAFGMSSIMVFSPEFPLRSGFSSTVQLIIATGILLRVQNHDQIKLITKSAKKVFIYVSGCYFIITTCVSFYNLYDLHMQTEKLLAYINLNRGKLQETVLTVKPFKKASRTETLLSGFHIVENELLEDDKSWENVAFARYYGIKGIRVSAEGFNYE